MEAITHFYFARKSVKFLGKRTERARLSTYSTGDLIRLHVTDFITFHLLLVLLFFVCFNFFRFYVNF